MRFEHGAKVRFTPDYYDIGGYWHYDLEKFLEKELTVLGLDHPYATTHCRLLCDGEEIKPGWYFMFEQLLPWGTKTRVQVPSDGLKRKFSTEWV